MKSVTAPVFNGATIAELSEREMITVAGGQSAPPEVQTNLKALDGNPAI